MRYDEKSPFYRLLNTKYVRWKEWQGLWIVHRHPEIVQLEWPGPDEQGRPFVEGSTALHYAANDGKIHLVKKLIDSGADPNASNAKWYRSVLSWAANNARLNVIQYLCEHGASPQSLDALHAAAWGGSGQGKGEEERYGKTIRMLAHYGADVNDTRYFNHRTPLDVALESGNLGAIEALIDLGAVRNHKKTISL